jgi:hypothetical protein
MLRNSTKKHQSKDQNTPKGQSAAVNETANERGPSQT